MDTFNINNMMLCQRGILYKSRGPNKRICGRFSTNPFGSHRGKVRDWLFFCRCDGNHFRLIAASHHENHRGLLSSAGKRLYISRDTGFSASRDRLFLGNQYSLCGHPPISAK